MPRSISPRYLKKLYIATAFLEGMSVLVVEIAGARALAPFFGTSLNVWTAQITATLLFLAMGYGSGGFLSKRPRDRNLPTVFLLAGIWLVMFPFARVPVLDTASRVLGISGGSFLSSAILFGTPLLSLGAVSPLLVERLDKMGSGAGSAAGTLFFTNTMGGIVGGWLTALWLVPHVPLRLVLCGTGIMLVVIGVFWGPFLNGAKLGVSYSIPIAALALTLAAPQPTSTFEFNGLRAKISYARQSNLGLIQVLDIPDVGIRSLLLDGAVQGGQMSGASAYEFTEYQNFLSHRYHPEARSALLLGLGAGVLARELVGRGVEVTVVELEPRVGKVARAYFGLPDSVRLIYEDARTYLNRATEHYDLVFLDVFAGENVPWYLTTVEAISRIKGVLNPGGRLIVNTMTWAQGGSLGLQRLESAILENFEEARVFEERNMETVDRQVANAVVVAGTDLLPSPEPFPGTVLPWIRLKLEAILKSERPAQAVVRPGTDDWSDLDYADAEVRLTWRKIPISELGAKILGD
jgi:spermidine synthase